MKIKRAIAAAIAAAMTATSCLVCERPSEAAAAVPTAKLVGVSANAYVCPIDTLTFDEGTQTYRFTITNDSGNDDTYVGGSLTINFFDYNEGGFFAYGECDAKAVWKKCQNELRENQRSAGNAEPD